MGYEGIALNLSGMPMKKDGNGKRFFQENVEEWVQKWYTILVQELLLLIREIERM
jgi:hypothetical protein